MPKIQLMIALFGMFDQSATGCVLIFLFFPLSVGSERGF